MREKRRVIEGVTEEVIRAKEEENLKIERQPPGRPIRARREHEKHIKEALGALPDKIKKIHRKKGKQRDKN